MDYEKMSVADLRAKAKDLGVRGISTLKKSELIEEIMKIEMISVHPQVAVMTRPQPIVTESVSEVRKETSPEAKREASSEVKREASPEAKREVTSEAKREALPENKREDVADAKKEAAAEHRKVPYVKETANSGYRQASGTQNMNDTRKKIQIRDCCQRILNS